MGPFLKSFSTPVAIPRPYASIQKSFHKGPLVAGSTAAINTGGEKESAGIENKVLNTV